jgi:peptide deformylase
MRPAMNDDSPFKVLQLGDPRLRVVSQPLHDSREVRDSAFRAEVRALARVLEEFRAKSGFGRAISAPQIGIAKRFLVLDLGDGPALIANPEITWRSEGVFTMWDDCMSFPGLLVRVERHESISIRYLNDAGAVVEWENLGREEAELLQHEIDHLDGVLATDRAVGESPFVTRAMFEESFATYAAQVDYTIPPPLLPSDAAESVR